jgi:ribose/xylose/arabinose/galactoside ABC-type transport system permease subunit
MKKFLNILLGLLFAITAVMVGWAVVSGGAEVAISWNLVWGYALLVGAVLSVLISAIKGTITNPAGLKKTMLAIVLVVVVVGAALFIALGHDGIVIPNSAGGVFDDPFELVISEVGILVTYVVAAASIIVTLYTEVRNLFK